MSRPIALLPALLLLGCAEPSLAPPAANARHSADRTPILSFTALGDGEEIRVHYHASGCFHDFESRLTVSPLPNGDAHVSVTSVVLPLLWERNVVQRNLPAERDTVLGAADLRELDHLLAYYRQHHEGNCTSSEEVELTLYRDGALVRRERYTDSTCSWYWMERPPRISFGMLVS